jgi:predicted NAD/FAD-binding protein
MTPVQRNTVQQLVAQGFRVVEEAGGVVRVTRNGDNRVVQGDGTQKRGHHSVPATGGRSSSRRG